MVLSWFRSTQSPDPSPPAEPTPSSPQPTSTSIPTPTPPTEEPATPTPTPKPNNDDDLPKLWTPQTNKKLFFGGALFFTLSLLTTRRALTRRLRASVPPYYTTSLYHKPEVNGGMEAFEALHLATVNVLSFGMMASGGVLWAMGINGIDDMRAYVKKGMAGGGRELSESDQELEREVEDWVMRYLGKRIEGGKLKDLNEKAGEGGNKST
ncbi:hypothetical protein BDW62DRAFT_200722 [Aspergillus aurantiobrunneus]